MLLIKNAKVYAPEYVGKKDLLVCGGKIECIEDKIEDFPIACEVIDAEERILTPGFIDQHVHVTVLHKHHLSTGLLLYTISFLSRSAPRHFIGCDKVFFP